MASQTIRSNQIVFMDSTDDRKIEVHIASNLPTVQIKNSNTGTYTPDWVFTNLQLTPSVFLDTTEITNDSQTSVVWYKQIGTNVKTQVSTNKIYSVSTNELSVDVGIITYICEATYQGIVAQDLITFTRVDTGKNGEDGTGINIKGTAASVSAISGTDYYSITYGAGVIQSAQQGDAYLYNGDLYVCADSRDGVDYFINVGRIQGPKGEDAKNIIISGDAQVFKVSKTSAITPTTIKVIATPVNTTITTWTYSVNGGQSFVNTAPAGVSRSGNTVTITGTALTTNSIVIKASDGAYSDSYTIYKVYDGEDGRQGDSASMAFLTNENITFSADESGKIIGTSTSFSTNVVAYNGTTKTTPTIGTITGLPTGMTVDTSTAVLNNEKTIIFNFATNSTLGSSTSNSGTITIPITSPVVTNLKLNWSKINTGTSGRGVKTVTEYYAINNNKATAPTTWATTMPVMDANNQYLWNYEEITYTDDDVEATDPVIIGIFGGEGKGISSIKSYYLATGATSGITRSTTGWTTTPQVMSNANKYLWNYEEITYTKGNPTYTDPVIIGTYGDQGLPGTPGSAASLVQIAPSALYFKSTTGKDGVFDPQYIYLYPRFQTVTYSNWQYSINGGASWANASGTNGLTIGTYNGVANSLQINRSSTLYTDTVTSISFRCNSNNSAVYDIVSVAKIYDVVDINIGARNLLINSDNEVTADREFVRYADIAPIFDKYGIAEYTISFDIKSADISKSKLIQVYCQNGSNTRYTIGSTSVPVTTTYSRQHIVVTPTLFNDTIPEAWLAFYGQYDTGNIPTIKNVKIEKGNVPTDWSLSLEDLIEEASNTTVMLSNEAHLFEADSNGTPIPTSIVLDVIGLKGSIQSPTTVGIISGVPSAGMTTSISDNNTNNTKIIIAITEALTSVVADYGTLTIPITVNDRVINKIFSWSKSKAGEAGAPGVDAVTFQVYSGDGYALSINTPSITLKTFAMIGDSRITADATYQWYSGTDGNWSIITGATESYLDVTREDVSFSKNYKCIMTFNNTDYEGVVTVDDKNDDNKMFNSKPSSYTAGDVWFVGADYVPNNAAVGDLLMAEHSNTIYSDSDWVDATNYGGKLSELEKSVNKYNEHFEFTQSEGLKIRAIDGDGNKSKFSTTLSSQQLSFNEGEQVVASISGNKMHIKAAEIESPLTVTGRYSGSTMLQAPVINIGSFSLIVESNGSLSIVANS